MAEAHGIEIAHTLAQLHHGSSLPSGPPILIVFINGLMLPRAPWQPTLSMLPALLTDVSVPIYALTYDRYGQGESRRPPPWKPELHDLSTAATELETILNTTLADHAELTATPTLLFVSHSIGVPLARLHNATTANHATGHLFLDSNISNTDFVSLLPDPDSPNFDASSLPSGITADDLRSSRERMKAMLHPSVPNPEGLDRSSVAELVPHADRPELRGPDGEAPWLTVVGHDPVAFAEEGLRLQGTPVALNTAYMQPPWDEYNRGLLRLSSEDRVKGVVIAQGAGHFVQRDNVACVAEEIRELVGKITK